MLYTGANNQSQPTKFPQEEMHIPEGVWHLICFPVKVSHTNFALNLG
jgi:hypothetical protein